MSGMNESEINSVDREAQFQEPVIVPTTVILDASSFSARIILKVVALTLLMLLVAGAVASVIGSLTYLFLLLVLAVFFAYLISPIVNLIRSPFKKRGIERYMPRPVAIVLAYLIVFSALGFAVANITPRVAEQAREFGNNFPSYVNSFRTTLNDLDRRYSRLRLPPAVKERIEVEAGRLVENVTIFITATLVGGYLLNFLIFSPWLIIVPILAFFFLKDVNAIRLSILRIFPPGRWRERADSVLTDINHTLSSYTRALLISCLFIGTIGTIGFYLIGLQYSLLLGILAGIFEFVPLLGPLAIGMIAVSTALFSDNPWQALYVAIFLIVIRIFHDYVTYPRIVRGGIRLHPLLIIISIIAGEQIAGIPGVFLAIPIVAIFTVSYRHFLEHQGKSSLLSGLDKDEEEIEEGAKEPA
jgi:predicted PurR-regulated permease PerM